MKKRVLGLLMAAAVFSIAAAGIGQAYAYFTTYVQASGKETIELGDATTISEEPVAEGEKRVTIQNSANSKQAVYVRVRAYSADKFELNYRGANWMGPANPDAPGDDGWAYYTLPVKPLEKDAKGNIIEGETDTLVISINDIPEADVSDIEKFNVVVVYETTPAIENGEYKGVIQYEEPDWNRKVTGGQNS